MFKTQVEPPATGKWFHCKVLNVFGVISMVYKSTDHEKEKINCATITSFLWCALLSTIAIEQSARVKSLNFCNKRPHNGKSLDSVQVPKSKPFYWCRKTSLQSKYWIEFIICLFFVNNHSLFAPLYDDCTHWTFVIQFLVAEFFFSFIIIITIFIHILVKSRSPLKFRTPRQTPFERRNCTFLLLYW